MLRIKKIIGIVFAISFLTFCFIPISISEETEDLERYFENRFVYVRGRFRYVNLASIFTGFSKPWRGSIIGELNISASGTKFERYSIDITNLTGGTSIGKMFNGNVTVILKNLTGIFFYGAFTRRERVIPPLLVFACYAEEVWVKWD